MYLFFYLSFFFFFNDTATTEIYTLSLHDALPIYCRGWNGQTLRSLVHRPAFHLRSEEHTSELLSHSDLVCRLLLEKKKTIFYAFVCKNKANTKRVPTSYNYLR